MLSFIGKLLNFNQRINPKITIYDDQIEIITPNGTIMKKAAIKFNKNEILIGSDDGINIFSVEDKKDVEYQGKMYQLTKEEMLAIYFDIMAF